MQVIDYRNLIQNLPVRQQCFTTKRTTWENYDKLLELFGNEETLTISRNDIFETDNLEDRIIKTIFWGYPRGMQGNNFRNILNNINDIINVINNINDHEPNDLNDLIKNINGVGISTFSKLLYFSGLTFNNNPCLILDSRLIEIFRNGTFIEYNPLQGINYNNASVRYLEYIELTNQIANRLKTNGENIEQFLFLFGKNICNV